QAVDAGKRVDRSNSHVSTYRRIVRCGSCRYSLIAERQKGHVYYRCHNRLFKNPAICPPTCVREDQIDAAVLSRLSEVDFADNELEIARLTVANLKNDFAKNRGAMAEAFRLQLEHAQSRLARLTDLLVDGTIEKSVFESKQHAILLEQARI